MLIDGAFDTENGAFNGLHKANSFFLVSLMLGLIILGIYFVLLWSIVGSIATLGNAAAVKSIGEKPGSGWKIFLLGLFAGPNTLLFGVVHWIFFHCHPTAQFNAGSDSAMDYWSFWVDQYFAFLGLSGFICVFHFLAFIVFCVRGKKMFSISICSLLCSAIVFWVIFVSAPTA